MNLYEVVCVEDTYVVAAPEGGAAQQYVMNLDRLHDDDILGVILMRALPRKNENIGHPLAVNVDTVQVITSLRIADQKY